MGAKRKERRKVVAYGRTSSATNVGADKDSEKRQRVAIEAFAKRASLDIVDWFYDPAVSGADPIGVSADRGPWRLLSSLGVRLGILAPIRTLRGNARC